MYRIVFSFILIVFSNCILINSVGAQSATWIGKAPFCSAKPADCNTKGMRFVRTHASGDGETCITGTKVMCEGETNLSSSNTVACPQNAKKIGGALVCSCKASQTRIGSVWGTVDYTDDSSICRAAVHAGVISASGGTIRITIRTGLNSYRGSSAHGIKSSHWKKYPRGFRVSK